MRRILALTRLLSGGRGGLIKAPCFAQASLGDSRGSGRAVALPGILFLIFYIFGIFTPLLRGVWGVWHSVLLAVTVRTDTVWC